MLSAYGSNDYQPVTYWGERPIYVTTIVLAACIFGLVLGIFTVVLHLAQIPTALMFTAEQFWQRGQLWRALTYWFFDIPDFFSVFSILFLWFYGKEVEKYIGRQRTIWFFGLMILLPVVLASLLLTAGLSGALSGPYQLCIATLVAFATLYPNVEVFGALRMKWLAWICVGLGTIAPLSSNDYLSLLTLLAECGAAFGYIRWLQRGGELPTFNFRSLFRRKPKLRVLPHPKQSREESALTSVDAILDKISKRGLGSLTAKEKALLEKGRSELLKREDNE